MIFALIFLESGSKTILDLENWQKEWVGGEEFRDPWLMFVMVPQSRAFLKLM